MNNNNLGTSQRSTPPLLLILTALAALTGLGLALFALIAPVGVWTGWWDFRQGFSILRSAQPFVLWITLGCAAITAIVLVVGRQRAAAGTTRLAGVAALATIAAGIAWYVPQSYLPGEGVNIPPIHDISTDIAEPPQFVDVLPLRGDSSNPTVYGTGNPNMTPEEHAERQREAYPDLTTRTYDEPASAVFERALAAVDMLGWELVAQDASEGRIEATDTTFWFRFKDDVVIRIEPTAAGTVVDARSTSRVGLSDVGKNAERLRAFFNEL
ncbi:DUF1499 domain-containing protein [Pseudohongiella sp.]|uniref:DUF1499 domain-containing protein n=1 Tax=marine sediment metagenome TaxID=412755 RepID=A0A0F9VJM2_9ZZZZ|nr:DUF1499 domain-containing protein [Pseudohongiella sp.]HDZ10536.1 DUF1499 domain-containing protein [Pseudohongiella sp.]HEA62451.1 DUF1499 domain-containing protein [Pseudohongiella sp.]